MTQIIIITLAITILTQITLLTTFFITRKYLKEEAFNSGLDTLMKMLEIAEDRYQHNQAFVAIVKEAVFKGMQEKQMKEHRILFH